MDDFKPSSDILKKLKKTEKDIEKAQDGVNVAIKFLNLTDEVKKVFLDGVFKEYKPSDKEILEKVSQEVENLTRSKFVLETIIKSLIKETVKEVIGELDYDLKRLAEKSVVASIVDKISTDEFIDDLDDY